MEQTSTCSLHHAPDIIKVSNVTFSYLGFVLIFRSQQVFFFLANKEDVNKLELYLNEPKLSHFGENHLLKKICRN